MFSPSKLDQLDSINDPSRIQLLVGHKPNSDRPIVTLNKDQLDNYNKSKETKCAFGIGFKGLFFFFFTLFSLFLLLFITPLHFLILFISFTVLF